MTIQFNPIDYVRQLEAAGVSKAEAQVHAQTLSRLIGNCVAVPGDLTRLDHDIRREIKALEDRFNARLEALEERFNARLEALEERFNARLEALEQRLTARIAALEARMDVFEASVSGQLTHLRWMVNTLAVLNGALMIKVLFT